MGFLLLYNMRISKLIEKLQEELDQNGDAYIIDIRKDEKYYLDNDSFEITYRGDSYAFNKTVNIKI